MAGVDFQSQISAIMEMLAGAAVAEICKLIEETCSALRLEISHSLREENEFLRNRVRVMERALLNKERESDPSAGYSQSKRPPVSSRIDHNSTDQPGERPGQAKSVKYEPIDLDSDPEVLIVKEETIQTACGGSSSGVKISVRANLCQTERVCIADFSEEPSIERGKCRGSSEEGKAALSAELAVQQDAFGKPVDTTEHGVQSEANIGIGMKTVSEVAETGSDFDQQHLEFLSAQQSSSHTEVKSDFLAIESESEEQEQDGLAAVLQRGFDEAVQQGNGASEHHNFGFIDSFSGTSLDHFYDPQVHPNQTFSAPQNRHGDGPSDSGMCGKSFSDMWQLKHHEVVNGEEKMYGCGRCGRQFPQLCRLKRHERVHTGEKPFRCSKCGKHFSQANNLKVHQSVHTGERRFSCAQCGKSFSFLSNLIRHKALHTSK